MAFPLRSSKAWSPFRSSFAERTWRRGLLRTSGFGILSLILLALFVVQSALLAVHGHAKGTDAGFVAGAVIAVEATAESGDDVATDPCAVCEILRRVGAEPLASAYVSILPFGTEPTSAPRASIAQIPARAEYSRAAPRAPPIAFV